MLYLFLTFFLGMAVFFLLLWRRSDEAQARADCLCGFKVSLMAALLVSISVLVIH